MLLANMLMLNSTVSLCSDLCYYLMWTKFPAFTIGSCPVGIWYLILASKGICIHDKMHRYTFLVVLQLPEEKSSQGATHD